MRRIYTVALFVVMASIDNTVLALLPTTTPRIREDLGVSNQALGVVIALNLAIVALTGLFWGYRSDQGDRRRLLILGTLAWVIPVGLVPLAGSYGTFLLLMSLAGLGLGCISTVGYSIITDLVAERWRGFTLGVWGLAQGIGALVAPIV
ncbi:MAG TPA: MFS transporter, partial [Herpetosiphonaceae bacterium]|nr:MFS transporter [Herpetosiphonaceae bacterium]